MVVYVVMVTVIGYRCLGFVVVVVVGFGFGGFGGLSLAEVTQQEVLVLAVATDRLDVAAEAMATGRIDEQFDERLLVSLEQLAVHTHRVLVEDVRVLDTVDEQEVALQVLCQRQQ